MRRLIYYGLLCLAFLSRAVSERMYMRLIVLAHKSQGVKFPDGMPEYIHQDAYLDPSGGLSIGSGSVISTRVIILTHDWSYLKREKLMNETDRAFRPVSIGDKSFIGAGAIILPGTTIGKWCIVGAGAVVKSTIEDFSIVAGNPAKRIGDTRD